MKERVSKAKHPWLAGIAIAAIALAYFYLLGTSRRPEPGPNLVFDAEPFKQVDQVETRFQEAARIVPTVESPKTLAVGSDGTIYVAAITGTPTCMALAPNEDLVLGIRNHIAIVSNADAMQVDWPPLDGRAHITSLAVNNDDIFVADAGNRVVLRFSRDGLLKVKIGEADPGRDVPGLLVPSPYLDVAFDADGALWVANPGRLGIESYRENGDLITSWYRPSMKLDGFSGCCNPSHFAFRRDGKLITCEKGIVRVKVYDATSGQFEELVAGSTLFPKEQAVRDLAVDSRDRILVLDSRDDSVRVFEQKEYKG
jgi:sugar lactone lactonase YvrE